MGFATVFGQVFIVFLLMGVGFIAGRRGFIHAISSKDMTQILCYIVSPCVIVKAFQQPFTPENGKGLLIAFIGVIGIYICSILVVHAIFNKKVVKDEGHRIALQFGSIYSNAGFVGIPLVNALLGAQGVFYGAPYLAGFNIFCWTHGLSIYNKKAGRKQWLKSLINPNIIAIGVGLVLFLFSIELPPLISTGITYIYDLNTPLSMLVIGDSISRIKFREILGDKWIWPGIFMRNLALPLLMLFSLRIAGVDQTVMMSSVIMSACPVAATTVLFAKMRDMDAEFPTKLMAVSTLLSMVTIPLVVWFSSI